MSGTSNVMRPCTGIWVLLVCLTLVTYAAGELGYGGVGFTTLVLTIAVIKSWFVAEYFMGLHRVAGFWRPLMAGYLIVLALGIALAFDQAS